MAVSSRAPLSLLARAALIVAWALPGTAVCHESDYSYLRLAIEGSRIQGEWEIHLRDALVLLELDASLEDDPAWAGVRARGSELRAHLAQRLELAGQGAPCPVQLADEIQERPGGRAYALFRLSATCPAPVESLTIQYRLLFSLDASHRGFFAVDDARQTHIGVFTQETQTVEVPIAQPDAWREFTDYLREGMHHIWGGLDHGLFLLALLLPAVLTRSASGWTPRPGLASIARETVGLVTAFTLAHSLTLSLAVLGVLRLPPRWVESAIAASVLCAAWNNIRPFLPGRTWALAFAFGLVHGFGFASALAGLGLPRGSRALALFSFNLGVEIGQIAVVVPLLLALAPLRSFPLYRSALLPGCSLLVAWLAALWLIERSLNVELL